MQDIQQRKTTDSTNVAGQVRRGLDGSGRGGPGIRVRRIRTTEASQLRTLRLRALADSPSAFEMTLQEEEQAPVEHWEEWARRGAAGKMSITFVATEGGRECGMGGGWLRREGNSQCAVLFGMWVEPAQRRRGIAQRLIQAVVRWARSRSAQHIELWVTEGNVPARLLYLSAGFRPACQFQPLRFDPSRQEELMTKPL